MHNASEYPFLIIKRNAFKSWFYVWKDGLLDSRLYAVVWFLFDSLVTFRWYNIRKYKFRLTKPPEFEYQPIYLTFDKTVIKLFVLPIHPFSHSHIMILVYIHRDEHKIFFYKLYNTPLYYVFGCSIHSFCSFCRRSQN